MLGEQWFTNGFYKTEDEQAWGFAHELSHAVNEDSAKKYSYKGNLLDFQLGSMFLGAATVLKKAYAQKLSTPGIMRIGCFLGISNIAALYSYYQAIQLYERRANDDAARWTTPDAGISALKKVKWSWDTVFTLKNRFKRHSESIGFSEHGSHGSQIQRLENMKTQRTARDDSWPPSAAYW